MRTSKNIDGTVRANAPFFAKTHPMVVEITGNFKPSRYYKNQRTAAKRRARKAGSK